MDQPQKTRQPSVFSLLKPYKGMIVLLTVLTAISNSLMLVIPQIVSQGIDSFSAGAFDFGLIVTQAVVLVLVIFIFTYSQGIMETRASEKVGRDVRNLLADKISRQSYAFIQDMNPSRLLTNLTSDIDSIKMFVGQAMSSLISSCVTIIGAAILLLLLDWRLALAVLAILPIIAGIMGFIMKRVQVYFLKSRETVDWLNKIINETILGSALVRVLNSQDRESRKFLSANEQAQNIGFKILNLFAGLIPMVFFMAGIGALIVMLLGGHFVIQGSMTLGNFAAFSSYVGIIIFPIFSIGFMSAFIAQAATSYGRINEILTAPDTEAQGMITDELKGSIEVNNVGFTREEKDILKNVSFKVASGTRTAIIGPTAGGKTQLLNLLIGLTKPDKGTILYDGKPLTDYDLKSFYQHVGFVFQDSIMFNTTLRGNIAFGSEVKEADLEKAIETAELKDFVASLPNGLETLVSERGLSLSGGQKQRIMLARALSLNPSIIMLDDFTARVDVKTEQGILANIKKNYPGITLISVTQKVASVEDYDHIIFLMEGEIIAQGTHEELISTSTEYAQMYSSQRSTSHYELQS